MSVERSEVYDIIAQFPDTYLKTLKESLILTLKGLQAFEQEKYFTAIPLDDEPTADLDRAIFAERKDEVSYSFDEVKKELGL